jgi:chemotaxis protein histidine kinase CheA
LATFCGLLVWPGDAVCAIPLSYVVETTRLESASVKTIIDAAIVNRREILL